MITLTSDELIQVGGGEATSDEPAALTALKGFIKDVNANPSRYENRGRMFGGPLVGFVRQTAPPTATK